MKKILFGITMILCLAGCANVTEEVPPVVDTSTCTVTFDSNGGTGSVPESQSVQKYLSIDVATENKHRLRKTVTFFKVGVQLEKLILKLQNVRLLLIQF